MFGRHKAMERFCIVFLALMIAMCGLMTTIVIRKHAADVQTMSTQAIYTTEVTMSRSHVTGDVVSISTSEDKTKAFVLLKMSSMANLSADAEDYRMFLTGATETQGYANLKSQPSGGIYVFGTTGYIGVYLVNAEPFPSQILNLVIRGVKDYSSSKVNGESNTAEIPKNGDASFENYDQMQIYFNPGAAAATHAEFLDADTINTEDMYKQSIVEAEEAVLRETLMDDLQSMFEYQRLADQYMTRLEKGTDGAVVMTPDIPDELSTDVITAYTYASGLELTWLDASNGWVDEEGTKYTTDDYYLSLASDYEISGGFNFNWQTVTSKAGWLDELRGSATIDEYLNQQSELLTQAKASGELTLDTSKIEWFTSDGAAFTVNVNSTDSKTYNISSDITKLCSAWESYYELKVKYETEDLRSLLYLERDARTVSSTYTENFTENVLINY